MTYLCETCGLEHPDSETHQQAYERLHHAHALAVTHGHEAAARDLARTLKRMEGAD